MNKNHNCSVKSTLMQCGHVSQGVATTNGINQPVCVICIGQDKSATQVSNDEPNLAGRQSKCSMCGKLSTSTLRLAFFNHQPENQYDTHYCGCRGWN